MTQLVNIMITKSAFVGAEFKESLDLALVCAAFDLCVNLIFTEDGVFNLLDDQHSQLLGEKNQVDLLKGLSFYDIDNVFADRESMISRALSSSKLLCEVELLDPSALNKLNHKASQVLVI